jgi:hypothetical protein
MIDSVGKPWSGAEVACTVESYLAMLKKELAGEPYNKAEENRKLREHLSGRSQAAVEFKHQNISAVLIELGWIPIGGYKPASNYQGILRDVVGEALTHDSGIEKATERALARIDLRPIATGGVPDIVSAPHVQLSVSEWVPRDKGIRRDYLQREGQNRKLGHAGELAVVAFEQRRLIGLGKGHLAAKVEHVSESQGDGLGFDVLSYDENGAKRMIEVKTTRYRSEIPFFVSSNEIAASKYLRDSFHIYRLFQFEKKPGMYTLRGPVGDSCELRATEYLAAPRG